MIIFGKKLDKKRCSWLIKFSMRENIHTFVILLIIVEVWSTMFYMFWKPATFFGFLDKRVLRHWTMYIKYFLCQNFSLVSLPVRTSLTNFCWLRHTSDKLTSVNKISHLTHSVDNTSVQFKIDLLIIPRTYYSNVMTLGWSIHDPLEEMITMISYM